MNGNLGGKRDSLGRLDGLRVGRMGLDVITTLEI